jgi:hypothetical protein
MVGENAFKIAVSNTNYAELKLISKLIWKILDCLVLKIIKT